MIDFVMMMLCLVFAAVSGLVFLFTVFIVGALIARTICEYMNRKH